MKIKKKPRFSEKTAKTCNADVRFFCGFYADYSCHPLALSQLCESSCDIEEIEDLLPLLDGCFMVHGHHSDRWLYAGLGLPEFIPFNDLWNYPLSPKASYTQPHPPFPGGVFLQLNYPQQNSDRLHTPFRPADAFDAPKLFEAVALKYPRYACYSYIKKSASLLVSHTNRVDIQPLFKIVLNSKNTNTTHAKSFPPTASLSRDSYLAAVRTAQRYIEAGDIYQINLATCFSKPWTGDPRILFHQLAGPAADFRRSIQRRLFSSALWLFRKCVLCSASPARNSLLRIRNGQIVTRPIKGTRAIPQNFDSAGLASARQALSSNPKELAELNMIVDLERNDLGRICNFGSVRVDSPGAIEQFPGLLHRVATVSGELRPNTTLGEVLEATFPGGSITGAPEDSRDGTHRRTRTSSARRILRRHWLAWLEWRS